MRIARADLSAPVEEEESSGEEVDDFQFGIWLRHRRIDGALNRVPTNFYAVSEYMRLLHHIGKLGVSLS